MPLKVCAIAAMDLGRVIGFRGALPWHIPEDLKFVQKMTKGHTVLMGRRTYECLPPAFKPLPGRNNVVVTRDAATLAGQQGIEVCTDALDYLRLAKGGQKHLPTDMLWVFGGAEIYKLTMPLWDELCLTLVHSRHVGDTFFPLFEKQLVLASDDCRGEFSFQRYERRK